MKFEELSVQGVQAAHISVTIRQLFQVSDPWPPAHTLLSNSGELRRWEEDSAEATVDHDDHDDNDDHYDCEDSSLGHLHSAHFCLILETAKMGRRL